MSWQPQRPPGMGLQLLLRLVPLGIIPAAVLGLVLLTALGGYLDRAGSGPAGPAGQGEAGLAGVQHPIARYTPGTVALGIGLADLCPHLSPAWAGARRTLDAADRRLTLARYGVPAGVPVAEVDHLVPRELGGADTVTNLWPQLHHDQDQRKDRLENDLHAQVCAGRLELAEAQQRARTFWRWW